MEGKHVYFYTRQSLRGLWSKPLTATSGFLSCVAMSTNVINAYVYNILINLCITQQPYLLLTSVCFIEGVHCSYMYPLRLVRWTSIRLEQWCIFTTYFCTLIYMQLQEGLQLEPLLALSLEQLYLLFFS